MVTNAPFPCCQKKKKERLMALTREMNVSPFSLYILIMAHLVIFTSPITTRMSKPLFSFTPNLHNIDWRVKGDLLLASLVCQFYLESLSSYLEDEANASSLVKEHQCGLGPKLLYSQLMFSSTSWPSILPRGICVHSSASLIHPC